METSAILQLMIGMLGIVLFFGIMYEIRSVTFKREPYEKPIYAWAMFLFFIIQIAGVCSNMKDITKWAMIIALVGMGFGASTSLLILRGVKATPRET